MVRVRVRARELVLAQQQERVRVRGLQERSHRRNRGLRLLESSWNRASIGQCCFSIHHQSRCASCEFLVRQPRMQKLQLRGMRRSCLV